MIRGIAAQAPRVVSGLAIFAVALAAGVISYQHVEDLTIRLHGTLLAARLMPVGVDGLIAVGSMILLQGGMLGWLCIGPGVTISLFANVESGIRYGWLAAVWAGIPAVSFALASFALERWLAGQVRKPAPDTDQDAPAIETVADASELPDADALPDAPPNAPDTETVTPPDRPKRPRVTPQDAEIAFASMLAECRVPSLRHIRRELPIGEPKAKMLRAHLESLIQEQARTRSSSAHAG